MPTAHACTITQGIPAQYDNKNLLEITWEWTSASDGSLTSAVTTTPFELTGYVAHFFTKPGTPAPTAYDINLRDDFGTIIASKSSASTSANESHTAGFYLIRKTLEIDLTGAGDAAQGTAVALVII
jgi:hypothetical protein